MAIRVTSKQTMRVGVFPTDSIVASLESKRRPECLDGFLNVAGPSGIGDMVWALTKMESIAAPRREPICVHVCEGSWNRSGDFCSAFQFVHKTVFTKFQIHPPCGPFTNGGPYTYLKSGEHQHGFDYLLIPNHDLERGKTLDEWLPELPTHWDIARRFVFDSDAIDFVQAIVSEASAPFVVFYLGPESGNTKAGFNRDGKWTIDDWRMLACLINAATGCHIYLVGAPSDVSYASKLWRRLTPNERAYFHNLTGKTSITQVFALIRASQFVVGYPSGIPIFASYLQKPTAMFMRPYGDSISATDFVSFHNDMGKNCLHKPTVEKGKAFVPMFGQATPDSVFGELRDREFLLN